MFEIENEMRVFFLTRHVSLKQACEMVKKERVLDYIIRCSEALKKIGINLNKPLAIAGLNPHAGDGGLFGSEEIEEIIPAIEEAKKLGYNVVGPIGADSIFYLARKGLYSAVLSMYHDQGHIATKTLDFNRTIAITLGMPILRTSVDHGTAFDIAGKGIADPTSMIEAIKLAAKYSIYFNN
jgi:4-hydroxythreonine-4-phosphate dehydrogenase